MSTQETPRITPRKLARFAACMLLTSFDLCRTACRFALYVLLTSFDLCRTAYRYGYHYLMRLLGHARSVLGPKAAELARKIAYSPAFLPIAEVVLWPVNAAMAAYTRKRVHKNSVLHISYMIHIPYYATRLLRRQGMKADFLAMGGPGVIWTKSDYMFLPRSSPLLRLWDEFRFFWGVVARYEVIHTHFGIMMTTIGWDLLLLKRLGRKIVVHYRGCEIRDRERNMALHPAMNICQQCDYNAEICRDPVRRRRVDLAKRYGDLFLVTTPDMLDFMPRARHFPFFLPQIDPARYAPDASAPAQKKPLRIVHVTGHPGIEGTDQIRRAVENLQAKGHDLEFIFLHRVPHEQVLREIARADLTVGKMKMGYYANAQIESMCLGVPAVTWVRPEFMTGDLQESGFIFSPLEKLEETIEFLLLHPEELERKRALARESITRLHDDDRLARELIRLYGLCGETA